MADAYGGKIVWTKVGSVTVSQIMKKLKAKLGGEENGGIFYGPHQSVRDGTMATALILDIMAENGKLSKLLGELPQYFIEKDKIDCPEQLKEKVLEKLIERVKETKVSTIDGVKIWFKDKSAILIRPSGTEPIYRLYAEARTGRKASELIKKYASELKKIISSLKH
jgi:phosphomannomutase/phosphoglucomutase